MTKKAVRVTVPFGVLERMPKRAGPPLAMSGPTHASPSGISPVGLAASTNTISPIQKAEALATELQRMLDEQKAMNEALRQIVEERRSDASHDEVMEEIPSDPSSPTLKEY